MEGVLFYEKKLLCNVVMYLPICENELSDMLGVIYQSLKQYNIMLGKK